MKVCVENVPDLLRVTVQRPGHIPGEQLTVNPNISLEQLRQMIPHCANLKFLVGGNGPLDALRESSLTVVDVFPKLFSGRKPESVFTFRGIDYQQIKFFIGGQTYDVLCALLVRLVSVDQCSDSGGVESLIFRPVIQDCYSSDPLPQLYEACSTGDAALVSELLSSCSLSTREEWFQRFSDNQQASPLHYAAENGHAAVCRLLLDAFPIGLLKIRDQNNRTALCRALIRKRYDVLTELLANAHSSLISDSVGILETYADQDILCIARQNGTDVLFSSPERALHLFHIALVSGDVSLMVTSVKLLVRSSPKYINARDELGWTLLHHAITHGATEIVVMLCEEGANTLLRDHQGLTPLALACQQGLTEVVSVLPLEKENNKSICKAIRRAIFYGKIHIVEHLLSRVAQDFTLDEQTWQMISCALQKNFRSSKKLLVVCPAQDPKGVVLNRFLLEAARDGDEETVKVLLSKVAVDINFCDYLGQSALHEAAAAGHVPIVRMLARHSEADVNMQNWRGETALHYASKHGHGEAVSELLQVDAVDVLLVDASGQTAGLKALYCGHAELTRCFTQEERHLRSLFVQDNFQMNVLHYACDIDADTFQELIGRADISEPVSPLKDSEKWSSVEPQAPMDDIYRSSLFDGEVLPRKVPARLAAIFERRTAKEPCERCEKSLCVSRFCLNSVQWHYGEACWHEQQLRRFNQPKDANKERSKPPKACKKGTPFACHGLLHSRKEGTCGHPLHVAVKRNRPDLLPLLARNTDDLHAQDSQHRCPLELSVDLLSLDCTGALVEIHKEQSCKDLYELIPKLIIRCLEAKPFGRSDADERERVLQKLLACYERDDQLIDVIGDGISRPCPLVHACSLGLTGCVSILLHCEPNGKYFTALLAAVKAGHVDVVDCIMTALENHPDGQGLLHHLGSIRDADGYSLLAVAVQAKGLHGPRVVRRIIERCPLIVDFPMMHDTRSTSQTFLCSGGVDTATLTSWRGNTLLEKLMEQHYSGLVERDAWEAAGCFLIEHGIADGIVQGPQNRIVHASCAALLSAVQQGFWQIAEALVACGAAKQAWRCAFGEPTGSSCKQRLGLMLDGIVFRLLQPDTPDGLLLKFLRAGLKLQASGAISMGELEAEQTRMLWEAKTSHRRIFEETSTSLILKVPFSFKAFTPVEHVVLQAIQPIIGWKQPVTRRFSTWNPFTLKAPKKRKDRKLRMGTKQTPPNVRQADAATPMSPMAGTAAVPGQLVSPAQPSQNTPRMAFTSTNRQLFTLSPRSCRLAARVRRRWKNKMERTVPSVFYLPSPAEQSPKFQRLGSPVSPVVLSPTESLETYIVTYAVPGGGDGAANSSSSVKAVHTPVYISDYTPHTPSKLNKFFIRRPLNGRMMQSLATILQLLPGLGHTITACFKDAKIDPILGVVPRRILNNGALARKFRIDKATLQLAFRGGIHEPPVFIQACWQGHMEVLQTIVKTAGADAVAGIRFRASVDPRKRNAERVYLTGIGAAASRGHLPAVEWLLEQGLQPTWADIRAFLTASDSVPWALLERLLSSVVALDGDLPHQTSVLCAASSHGMTCAVRWILAKYPHLQEHAVLTNAFSAAISHGHSEASEVLFDFLRDADGEISLMPSMLVLACQNNLWHLASMLLDHISLEHLTDVDKDGRTVLHYAAREGKVDFLESLVSHLEQLTEASHKIPELLNLRDVRDRTAFWYACREREIVMAEALILFGANVADGARSLQITPSKSGSRGWEMYGSSQMASAMNQELAVVTESLDQPIHLKFKTLIGCSVRAHARKIPLLQMACCDGLEEIVKLVISRRAHIVRDSAQMVQCLCYALLNGHVGLVQYLLQQGALVDKTALVRAWLLRTANVVSGFEVRFPGQCSEHHVINTKGQNDMAQSLPHGLQVTILTSMKKALKTLWQEWTPFCRPFENENKTTSCTDEWLFLLDSFLSKGDISTSQATSYAILLAVIGRPEVTERVIRCWPQVLTAPALTPEWPTLWRRYTVLDGPLENYRPTLLDMLLAYQTADKVRGCVEAMGRVLPSLTWNSVQVLIACQRQMAVIPIQVLLLPPSCLNHGNLPFTFRVLCSLLSHASDSHFEDTMRELSSQQSVTAESSDAHNRLLTLLLHFAVRRRDINKTRVLVALGANGCRRLENDDIRLIGPGIKQLKWLPPSKQTWSALHRACSVGCLESFKLCLAQLSPIENIAVEKLDSQFCWDLGQIAASCGQLQVLQWLSSEGVLSWAHSSQVSRGDNIWPHLLKFAAENGHLAVVQWLVDQQQYKGETPEHHPARTNVYHHLATAQDELLAVEIINTLLASDIPGISRPDSAGFTPATYAYCFGNVETFMHLIEREVDLGSVDVYVGQLARCYGAMRHSQDPLGRKYMEPGHGKGLFDVVRPADHADNAVQMRDVKPFTTLVQCLKKGADQLAVWMMMSAAPALKRSLRESDNGEAFMGLAKTACKYGCSQSLNVLLCFLRNETKSAALLETELGQALSTAVARCQIACVEALERHGTLDLNTFVSPTTGENIIHLALKTMNKGVVAKVISMLGNAAKVAKQPNTDGLTAVDYARSLDGMNDVLAACLGSPVLSKPQAAKQSLPERLVSPSAAQKRSLMRDVTRCSVDKTFEICQLCWTGQVAGPALIATEVLHYTIAKAKLDEVRQLFRRFTEEGLLQHTVDTTLYGYTLAETAWVFGKVKTAIWLTQEFSTMGLSTEGNLASLWQQWSRYKHIISSLDQPAALEGLLAVCPEDYAGSMLSLVQREQLPEADDFVNVPEEVQGSYGCSPELFAVKERIKHRTIPALNDMLKKTLGLKNVDVEMDWDSFVLESGEEPALELLDVFHHFGGVEFAGLGPTIHSCGLYQQMAQRFGRIPDCTDNLQTLLIRFEGVQTMKELAKEENDTNPHQPVAVWAFSLENGRVLYDPSCLPFWWMHRWMFLAVLSWESPLKKVQKSAAAATSSRCPKRVSVRIDWESLVSSVVLRKSEIGELITGPIADEINRFARMFCARSERIEASFSQFDISFTKAGEACQFNIREDTLYIQVSVLGGGEEKLRVEIPAVEETLSRMMMEKVQCGWSLKEPIELCVDVQTSDLSHGRIRIELKDATVMQWISERGLLDLESPVKIATKLVHKVKKDLALWAKSAILRSYAALNAGVYVCPSTWPSQRILTVVSVEGRKYRIIDDEFLSALQDAIPPDVRFFCPPDDSAPADASHVVSTALPSAISCTNTIYLGDLRVATTWSQTHSGCHDIPHLIQEDVNVQEKEMILIGIGRHLKSVLPTLDEPHIEQIVDALRHQIGHPNVKRDIRNIHQLIEMVHRALGFLSRTTALHELGNRSSEELLSVLQSLLMKSSRKPLHEQFINLVSQLSSSPEELSGYPCPAMCTIPAQYRHVIHFPVASEAGNGVANEEVVLKIKLNDANGQSIESCEETDLKVDLRLIVKRPEYRCIKLTSKASVIKDTDGFSLNVSWNKEDINAATKKLSKQHSSCMAVMINGCHIQDSPFPVFFHRTLGRTVGLGEEEFFKTPTAKPLQVLLMRDCKCSPSSLKSLGRRSNQQSIVSSASRALPAICKWRQLVAGGWKQVWSLGGVCGLATKPVTCAVTSLPTAGLLSLAVTSRVVGELHLQAYCMTCLHPLQFLVPDAAPRSELLIMVTPGEPSPTSSYVVDKNLQSMPRREGVTWRRTAGECFTCLFCIRDRGIWMHVEGVSHLPDFSLNLVGGFTKVELSCSVVNAADGLWRLTSPPLTAAGTYELCMGERPVRNGALGYTVLVLAAEPDPGFCYAHGEGLSTVYSAVPAQFKITLHDRYDNDIQPSRKMILYHQDVRVVLESGTPCESLDVVPSLKISDSDIICSYKVPSEFRGRLKISVFIHGVHARGSPYTARWTSLKSFSQRHRELRRALQSMKRVNGHVDLWVGRDTILEDTFYVFQQMAQKKIPMLHYSTIVHFNDEKGVDAGGLTREWYQLLSRAMFNPNYVLFEEVDGRCYRPNTKSWVQENHLDHFYYCGQVFAKAIVDGDSMDVHLAHSVYKSLLERPLTLSDLGKEDAVLHKNLTMLKEMTTEEEVEAMCLTFAIDEPAFGENLSVPLKPGGADIEVTLENRSEYIHLYTTHVLRERIKKQLEHLHDGFVSVLPQKLISEFSPTELEFLICGHSSLDLELLRNHTTYGGNYSPKSRQVLWLWQLLSSWKQEKKEKFLQFVTGNTRMPACTQDWRLTIESVPSKDQLPTASTCFNILKLPTYSSKALLKKQVTTAIVMGSQGFGQF